MGAKYQKGLDKTKEFLKSHSALTIREVCEKAEIEQKDADILINRFNKRRGRLHVSYDRGLTVKAGLFAPPTLKGV